MASSRVRQLLKELEVDVRTDSMSDEALNCRARGHKWGERGMTRKRYNDLILQGIMEDALYCENGCGCTWTIAYSLRTGLVVENKREYPKTGDYLMRKGSGRMNRAVARVARGARQLAAVA